jgi:hypothetical protein
VARSTACCDSDKSAATDQLTDAFRAVDTLLEGQIDRVIFRLRKTRPALYAAHQWAREVVELAAPRHAGRTGVGRIERRQRRSVCISGRECCVT